MSVCATNSVAFDSRKVSLSRRKLVDNERWAMLNKKTFQEILNALLAQSTSQPTSSSSSSSSSSSTATALTFALGSQRSNSSAEKNRSSAPLSTGRSATMKGGEYDLSGDGWTLAKDECRRTTASSSSNLESDETLTRVGCRIDNDDDDDDDNDYDVEMKDRCRGGGGARDDAATDSLHSIPAAPTPAAASSAAVATAGAAPFIVGLGGGAMGQKEFILGQSHLAAGVGENPLQGPVGIFIVCAALPPCGTDVNPYHFAAQRLLGGAPVTPNTAAPPIEECAPPPQARSLVASAAFSRIGSEAVSGAASERVARDALPRFRFGEKYEKDGKEEGSDEEEWSRERWIDRPYPVQGHGVGLRSALPVRNRSRIPNGYHHAPRSFDLNKASRICSSSSSSSSSRRLSFSAGKPGLTCMRRFNPDQLQVPPASESFISGLAQTSTTASTETSRASDGGSVSTEIRCISGDSSTEIMSASTAASVNPRHTSAESILRRGIDVSERAQPKNLTDSGSTFNTCCTVIDLPFLPTHVSTGCGGLRTKALPSKTNVALPKRTMAPQQGAAAGLRHSEQSLSLSWSRWMAVDKDVLFCIIEHVLNAEAANVAFNTKAGGFCFKSPPPTTTKAFSSAERGHPIATDFDYLPDSSWRKSREHLHWAALFRSSQLGGIFEETGNRSSFPFPVGPCTRKRPEVVVGNRTIDENDVIDNFDENNMDDVVSSRHPGRAEETRRRDGDSASVEISRRFAHFRLGRAPAIGEKPQQRHRATGRRRAVTNRKRKCFQYDAGSGFADRVTEATSPDREAGQRGLMDDDDVDRQGEGTSRGEQGVSSFKWKSKMMMRLCVESRHVITDTEVI